MSSPWLLECQELHWKKSIQLVGHSDTHDMSQTRKHANTQTQTGAAHIRRGLSPSETNKTQALNSATIMGKVQGRTSEETSVLSVSEARQCVSNCE